MRAVPIEAIQQLIDYCKENDLGMAQIGDEDGEIMAIIVGDKKYTPDQVSIIVAHMMLTGIISGGFHDSNDAAKVGENKRETEIPDKRSGRKFSVN